jgi:hypothetical protein
LAANDDRVHTKPYLQATLGGSGAVSSGGSIVESKPSRARRIALTTAVTILVLGVVPVALAGKGRHGGGGTTGGTGTLSLVLLNSTDGYAHFGQKVTFNVSTSATTQPWVTVKCYQSGTLVGQQSNGIFATSLSTTFTLGPTQLWSGGAANCTATLENWDSYPKSVATLASMSFDVYA